MSAETLEITGRTVARELFIAAAPERVYRAFTEKSELERWFVTNAEVDLRPGGVYNLTWQNDYAAGTVVSVDPPRQFVFTWDDGPANGVTTCQIDFVPQADGTLVRLVHTGFGDGEDWDRFYDGVNSGWTEELANLQRWLESGLVKDWGQ